MNTILIVEDEVETADVVREVLEHAGYRTLVAHDGREGLQTIAAEEPDLVITDIMMPVMDGTELIERLHDNPATCDIPVIAVSGTEKVEHRPFLRKPYTLDDLLEEVHRQLNSGHRPGSPRRPAGE